MTRRSWMLALAAAALFGATGAAIAQEVALKRTQKSGEKLTWEFSVKGMVAGAEFTVNGHTTEEVLSTSPTDGYRVKVSDKDVKVTVMGQPQDQPVQEPTEVQRDPRGRLLDNKGPANNVFPPEVLKTMLQLGEVVLPEKAVKVGDEWKAEYDNLLSGAGRYSVSYTLLAVEKIEGEDAWKIGQKAEVAGAAGAIKDNTVYWLSGKDGALLKRESKKTGVPTPVGDMSWNEMVSRTR